MEKKDGLRILVDRLWPRGLTKNKAHVDFWMKDIAPSPKLRIWFGHEPTKWVLFKRRYLAELHKNKKVVEEIKTHMKENKKITLLYGAKDTMHNHALILQDFLS